MYHKLSRPVLTQYVTTDPRAIHGLRARCHQLEDKVARLTKYVALQRRYIRILKRTGAKS